MRYFWFFAAVIMSIPRANCQYNFVNPIKSPGGCMMDAYSPVVPRFRENLMRAVFTYASVPGAGRYTGTLINRNTREDNLGNYFVTSWHCFKNGATCGGAN